MDKQKRHRMEMLNVLSKAASPVTSARLAQDLAVAGHDLSERAVRLYLSQLDAEGMTEPQGRRGRVITDRGLVELHATRLLSRVDFISARIDQMTYRLTFDLATRTGQLAVNISLVCPHNLATCTDTVCSVFDLFDTGIDVQQGLRLASLAHRKYAPVFDTLSERDRAALAFYFLPLRPSGRF